MELERYRRNLPEISPAQQDVLAEKHVLIVGCGGLGGYIIEALARAGAGHLRLMDGDTFKESDLNRQLLASSMNLGRPKTLAARQRILAVNSLVEVEEMPYFLSAENAAEALAGCHLAIDALDNVPSRLLLAEACAKAGLPMLHGAVGAWYGQAALLPPGSKLLERVYPAHCRGLESAEKMAMLAPVVMQVAALQASLALRFLLGDEQPAELLWHLDMERGSLEKISF